MFRRIFVLLRMKSIKNILVFLLATVFLYSVMGQSIILHYCNMDMNTKDCPMEKSCTSEKHPVKRSCCEEEPVREKTSVNGGMSCCMITSQFLVNPFSVKTPDKKIEISVVAHPFISIQKLISTAEISVKHFSSITADCSPPGRTILLLKNVLVI
ncbi:MAG: hypothetical protein ABI772_10340 [Bacteroidota bacterium]